MRRRLAGLCAALALSAAAAAAAEASAAPREIADTIHAARPYGKGTVSFVFFKVYDAALWTDAAHWSITSCFALTLHYSMGFSSDEIVSRTMDEMQRVAPQLGSQMQARYRAMLPKLFPAVAAGDTITALNDPGKPVRFFQNGVFVGQSDDAAFAAPFFAIWLSPATSNPGLRAQLLLLNATR